MLKVSLLGPPEISVGDGPLGGLYSRKGVWLFALLALRAGKEVDRAWLAATLWPDAIEATGLFYLRRELTGLRKGLGEEARRLTSPVVSKLRLDLSGVEFDVRDFDEAVTGTNEQDLQKAVALYRGGLLEGCLEEWVISERESREVAYAGALEELANRGLAQSEPEKAIPNLRKLVMCDPLRESAHRSLMRALVAKGDVAAARKVFRDLRLMLARELNVDPAPETLELVSEIRADLRQQANRIHPNLESNVGKRSGWLPQPLTTLIGRVNERASIVELMDATRLLTLIGTGGVGKTRLALEVAESGQGSFADGAWFVDLSAVSDGKLVGHSIAAVLEIRESSSRSVETLLVDHLRTRHLLLVLDNCEQVVDETAQIVERLLHSCRSVKVLATSRQALGVTGERTFRVPSLDTPPETGFSATCPESEDGRTEPRYDSVRLFIERANQAGRFSLSPQNSADVAHICRRLGGIPLAIELAAARVHSMPTREIAERLDDRFALLSGGVRSGVPRQQTLRASVDWSYDLISKEGRLLFRRLSVFGGGFQLGQAEAICGGELTEVQGLISELVDKSLVLFDDWAGRYSLLETMRQYSSERQRESGETDAYRDRHLRFFLAFAEEAEPHMSGPDQLIWLDRLEGDHDNLRLALHWSLEGERNLELGLRLAASLSRFWTIRGYSREGRDWLSRLLTRNPNRQDPTLRCNALSATALLAIDQGDVAAAGALLDEDIAGRQKLGDKRGLAFSLNLQANLALLKGDSVAEWRIREECLAIWRELDDPWGIAVALGNLGWTAYTVGDHVEACALQEQSLAIRRELGLQRGIANSLHLLGVAIHALGDLPTARVRLEESLAIQREIGWAKGVAVTLRDLAHLSFDEGEHGKALSNLGEALGISKQIGDRGAVASCLDVAAQIAAGQGDAISAARLWGASARLRQENGLALPPDEKARFDRNVAAVRTMIGTDAAFESNWREGQELSTDRAIDFALSLGQS